MSERTVLVIDDDIDLVEIIRVTLEREKMKVIDAQNGERGFALAKERHPDLVLLDVMMGTIDEGFQVAYKLRGEPLTKDIPIIMMSAVGERTGFTFDKSRDADFLPVSEFLEKPVSPRKLVDMVRKHLPTTT
ncbi:response regulator [bacterium]|nr:response regulator [bacterium]